MIYVGKDVHLVLADKFSFSPYWSIIAAMIAQPV